MDEIKSFPVYKRHPLYRVLNFLLLLPFVPAGAVLWQEKTLLEVILFISGFLLVLMLIILNNRRPVITMDDEALYLHLLYSHKPEKHPYSFILGYRIRGKRRIKVFSFEHAPVKLYMRKKERMYLIEILQEKKIYEASN